MTRKQKADDVAQDALTEEEMQDVLIENLSEHDGIDWGHLRVRVREGEIYLTGQVGTEEEKQIAELVALDALDTDNIKNYIRVDPWSSKRYEPMTPLLADDPAVTEGGWSAEEMWAEAGALNTDDEGSLQNALEEGVPWDPPEMPQPGLR